VLIFEDPPVHDIHRKLLARMFTPRKIALLEQKIRDYCVACLDPVVGTGTFDFVTDLGAVMPMKTISALNDIPEADEQAIRDHVTGHMKTEAGKPMKAEEGLVSADVFAEYVDWRVENPSDDIMTELVNVEFVDEMGATRKLTRDELLIYINVVARAGNDTTTRLIGWAAKVLAEHPDQRRQLVDDPTLIPKAVEELVRFEPPAPHVARYVTRDVEIHGRTVPAGSVMMMLIGAANRDGRQFPPDGDVFDINREQRPHLGFSVGAHYCLGSSLARLEGRVALEEILKRSPEWEVDLPNAVFSTTSTIRGWDSMPAFVG
jgi:cytochrome P450